MVRRRRADFLTRDGRERRDSITVLTPAAFTICVDYHLVASLEMLIRAGFSANRNCQRQISAPAPEAHRRALALRRSSSTTPAMGGDSFRLAIFAWRQIPCANRRFVQSVRGPASRLDF